MNNLFKKIKRFGERFSVNKRFKICLTFSIIVHCVIVFFMYFQQQIQEFRERRLISVEYKEEERKKKEAEKKKEEKKEEEKRPEPKAPTPQQATITMKDFMLQKIPEKVDEDILKKLERFARPMNEQIVDMKIDLDKMIDAHQSQVAVDLDAFAEDIDLNIAVLRVGKGVSTDEILAQDKFIVPLDARALPAKIGAFAQAGFSKAGGEGGIELTEGTEDFKADVEKREVFKQAATQKKEMKAEEGGGPKTEVEITGALADRKLIKWPLPPYPEWAQQQGISAYLNINLKVGADGKVTGTVITISTTGYPQWDEMVINWIKSNWLWQNVPGLTSPGAIGIRFRLD